MFLYFILLLTGFLWIGVTAVSRHVFVLLKRYIGKEISDLEFLSTQFIVLLLPFLYMKLKKEVRIYNGKKRCPIQPEKTVRMNFYEDVIRVSCRQVHP